MGIFMGIMVLLFIGLAGRMLYKKRDRSTVAVVAVCIFLILITTMATIFKTPASNQAPDAINKPNSGSFQAP